MSPSALHAPSYQDTLVESLLCIEQCKVRSGALSLGFTVSQEDRQHGMGCAKGYEGCGIPEEVPGRPRPLSMLQHTQAARTSPSPWGCPEWV